MTTKVETEPQQMVPCPCPCHSGTWFIHTVGCGCVDGWIEPKEGQQGNLFATAAEGPQS